MMTTTTTTTYKKQNTIYKLEVLIITTITFEIHIKMNIFCVVYLDVRRIRPEQPSH